MSEQAKPLPLVSPLATHVLELRGFSPVIKTSDLHKILAPWSGAEMGGYRIKWRDDSTAYILFYNASVAKHAYLALLSAPPPILRCDYDGNVQDAQGIPCARLTSVEYAEILPCHGPEAASLMANSGITIGANVTSHAPTHRRIMSGTALPNKPTDMPMRFPQLDARNRRAVSGPASDARSRRI